MSERERESKKKKTTHAAYSYLEKGRKAENRKNERDFGLRRRVRGELSSCRESQEEKA